MAKRKKKVYQKSKWADEACLLETKIIRFEEQNKICPNDKFKNVFYCVSKLKPEGRMCVLWERTVAQPGDTVIMKGRFKDDVFLVWSLTIMKRAENRGEN